MAYGKVDPRIRYGVDEGFPGQGPPLPVAERLAKLEQELADMRERLDEIGAQLTSLAVRNP